MRKIAVAGTLLFSGLVFAESQLEIRVNRIDMAVTAPDDTSEAVEKETVETTVKPIESAESRASADGADYNSSRSNKTRALDIDDDDDGVDVTKCENDVDNDCDAPRDADPANHNSTRSK